MIKEDYSMSSSSLHPIFSPEIPDMAMTFWREVVRRAFVRFYEIDLQRVLVPEILADWHRLHGFEYNHFYSAWVAVPFRFQACADHNRYFTAFFQRTRVASPHVD